jgi:hypothetical protein
VPIQTTLLAFVPSLLIAAAVLAAVWQPWSKGDRTRPAWAGAVALAVAFIASDAFVWRASPGWWPAEEQRRLRLVALLAVLASYADGAMKGRLSRTSLAWVCGAVLTAPILFGDISRPATYPVSLVYWLAYSGAVAILWSENAAVVKRVGGSRAPVVMCTAAAGACVVLMQHSVASVALTAAGLSAGAGAFVALAWWRPDLRAAAGAPPVFAALLAGLLASVNGMNVYSVLLVFLSAGTPGLGDRGPFRSMKPWAATLACVILSLALIAGAVHFSPNGFDFKPE